MTRSHKVTIYILEERKLNRSTEHEKAISTSYAFDLQPLGQTIMSPKLYFEQTCFLQSLMPLTYLIPSSRRVETLSASSSHPMNALLGPLLLTTRTYCKSWQMRAERGDGGSHDVLFSVEYEKPDDFDGPRNAVKEGQWTDMKWRERYLERMERREYVLIDPHRQKQLAHSQRQSPNTNFSLHVQILSA
jgi:hypothetical protein